MRWRSFVAVGDSFTEGLNDILPDGRVRGWADLVAARLATERAARSSAATTRGGAVGAATSGAAYGNPAAEPTGGAVSTDDGGFRYANLAVRGRLFRRIVDEA